MKKKLWIITAIVLLCGIVFAAAASAEGESPIEKVIGNYTIVAYGNEATILDVDTSIAGAVSVPDTLDIYTVTAIGDEAFAWCNGITSVTIPATVKSIGKDVFVGCTLVEFFAVAAGNANFVAEAGVLFNKDKTTLVAYPSGNEATIYGVPNTTTTIADGAFHSSYWLESVTIPKSVTAVGDYAFYECAFMNSVTIEAGSANTSIGEHAFGLCEALKNVTLPANVSSVGSYAFEECYGLESVIIMNNSVSIAENAFYNIEYTVTLYGNADSNTFKYATTNTPPIPFKVIGAESYTISGKITAAAAGDVTITLLDESKEEVAKDTVTITEAGKAAEYSITVEEAGEYTLRVSMDKHVTREYTVLVGGED